MTQQKRGEGWSKLSEVLFPDLPIPNLDSPPPPLDERPKALTTQKKGHFTRLHQIDALADIGEDANPDMGFMARLLTLCTLPRTDPGNRLQYKRENGPFRLYMIAGGGNKLPFGNLPRLLLAWVSTEAVRTRSRDLQLGQSLLGFMRELGMYSNSGGERGDRTRLRHQIDRLFSAHVELIHETADRKISAASNIADYREFWWDYKRPEQDTLWQSRIRLGEAFFNEIIAHPIPLDMRILKRMRRSSLGLDLYMWLTYKTHTLTMQGKGPQQLSWKRLYRQFGAANSAGQVAGDDQIKNFRKDALRELRKLKLAWPTLDYATPEGCLEVRPCLPSVRPKALKN